MEEAADLFISLSTQVEPHVADALEGALQGAEDVEIDANPEGFLKR